ncbi:dihydrodipicolinate reductase [Loktanella sp. M215]|uniref:dihydrodipicolinate reductase n=1 Tax=Loktanella sp. M215 TaxID=2675431 RepID=UPI001F444866|nr:dihydrodipicolinate reductase [Loktanella sp. M215]MCF7699277.1 dihydrodipicolinate reductase [Loktanella sp. M215]
MKTLTLAMALSALPLMAAAQDYTRVSDRDQFLALMAQGNLTHTFYNITVTVTPDGQIAGDALGWPVTGAWSWEDGYFCRVMDWGGDEIPYNCQLVEQKGDLVRFTVDQGAGRAAALRIR